MIAKQNKGLFDQCLFKSAYESSITQPKAQAKKLKKINNQKEKLLEDTKKNHEDINAPNSSRDHILVSRFSFFKSDAEILKEHLDYQRKARPALPARKIDPSTIKTEEVKLSDRDRAAILARKYSRHSQFLWSISKRPKKFYTPRQIEAIFEVVDRIESLEDKETK